METLENAYDTAKQLPREKQNALAAMIQGEIEDEPLSYDDARTLLGLEQAMRGEGSTPDEVRTYFKKKSEALKTTNE